MNLYEVSAKVVQENLGVEVPEEYIIIAKHQVLGLANEQIAETLGASIEEIQQVEADPDFKRTKQFVGLIQAEQQAAQTTGWDNIESKAIELLAKKIPFETDKEFLLKVATLANRAQRRATKPDNVLDPTRMGGRATITLTQRLVEKINAKGEQSRETERTLSIKDGSMGQPTFGEVDSLLSVKAQPVLAQELQIQTRVAEPTIEELTDDFMRL